MNEIEKMYRVAKVAPSHYYSNDCQYDMSLCPIKCPDNVAVYPPFTAEKQLELIKEIVPGYPLYYASGDYDNFSFEEGLACRINRHWEHWNNKQKQQIKEILEWAK